MVKFSATLEKMGNKGEKTGWVYVLVPDDIANTLKPNNKKEFKAKGYIENFLIEDIAVIPVVEIGFIIAINVDIRKKIEKKQGDKINLQLQETIDIEKIPSSFLEEIKKNEIAFSFFYKLSVDEQNNFSNWIKSAKASDVIEKRIKFIIKACSLQMNYGQMMQAKKDW